MRNFRPAEDLYHRPTSAPVKFVRAVGYRLNNSGAFAQ
jgi:hypothetical protein